MDTVVPPSLLRIKMPLHRMLLLLRMHHVLLLLLLMLLELLLVKQHLSHGGPAPVTTASQDPGDG